jgi:structural hemagglutinin/hemolysin toxin protein RtxA
MSLYQLSFHVPETHLEEVKNAIFQAGAGNIGGYSQCAWQTLGTGQFMPREGSHAYVGSIDKLERISEYKVETICEERHLKAVVAALKLAHPYEVPSYQVIMLETI